MKKLKKIISILLTAGTICSMSVTTYADGFEGGSYTADGTAVVTYKVATGVDEYGDTVYETKWDVPDPYAYLNEDGARISRHVNLNTKKVELCKDSGYKIQSKAGKYNVVCSYCDRWLGSLSYRNNYYYMTYNTYKQIYVTWPYTDTVTKFVLIGKNNQKNPDMSQIYDFTGETYQEIYDKIINADNTYGDSHAVYDENFNLIKFEKCTESECGCHIEEDVSDDNELTEICNGCKREVATDTTKLVSKKAQTIKFKKDKKYTIATDEDSINDYFYEQNDASFKADSGIKSVSAKASKAGALTSFKWNSKTGKATFKLKQKCTVTLTVTTNLGGKAVMKYKFK